MGKKQKQRSTPISTIKGYLPIRLSLPPFPLPNAPPLTTFIYIKEHIAKQSSTLFVANTPANGPIRTDLFLRAVFGRYGEIERVTVANEPRKTSFEEQDDNAAVEMFRNASLMFLGESSCDRERGDGKFAHVVFSSGKEMKRALKGIRDDVESASEGMIVLDDEVLDSLIEQTTKLRRTNADSEDTEVNEDTQNETLTGIHAIAHQYKQKHMPRQKLMELCNQAMSSYEQSEAQAAAHAKRLAEQPDEDGFITVTHNSSTPSFGATNDLETTQHEKGRGKGRNRKRKAGGAGEFKDFYKFQWKEIRKKEVGDLKARFEEDLEKVKRMKEERAFRPF